MNRQQMISILASMDDQSLIQALEVNGISAADCGAGMDLNQFGPEMAPGLESWTQRHVSIPRTERPLLADTDMFFGGQQIQPQRLDPFGPQDDSQFYEEQAALGLGQF